MRIADLFLRSHFEKRPLVTVKKRENDRIRIWSLEFTQNLKDFYGFQETIGNTKLFELIVVVP